MPGFVVPAIAFWDIIESLGKSEPLLADLPHSSLHMDVDNPRQLQLVAQQIRQKITAAVLPPALASALSTAAEAVQASAMILHPSLFLPLKGLQVGRLQVERSNLQFLTPIDWEPFGILASHTCVKQPEALAMALKRVWAELFRARSLFYWQRHGIGLHQINVAVLVQPLWDAIASGILRTGSTEWHLEATWGISTALINGEIFPDSYQVQATTGIVKTQQLGSKTRVYHPSSESDSLTPVESGVQAHLASEEQQQQYALEEKYLKQLIELSQQLASEITPAFFLEWTLCQPPGSSEPQLYLAQVAPQPLKSHQVNKFQASRFQVEEGLHVGKLQAERLHQPSNLQTRITPQLVRGLPAAGGRVTATAQVLRGENPNIEEMIPGRILVAQSVAPTWLPLLKQAAGVVTERGGMTSHAAILARELGIPAVVGATNVTQLIQTGESVLVDGNQGEIHRLEIMESGRGGVSVREAFSVSVSDSGRSDSEQAGGQRPTGVAGRSPEVRGREGEIHSVPVSSSFSVNYFPIATKLLVNLSQPNFRAKIVDLPVDGVGLLRSELMMLDALENLHPNEWLRQGRGGELAARLAQLIVQFAAAFAPRPVYYRSSDWRSHEFQFLLGNTSPVEPEVNPIVGLRGTRCYLSEPACFDLELAALREVYASGYTNVHLMLPFVRDVEEFAFCRRRVQQAELTDNPHFQLWIMAEVPSVLFMLPDYVKAGVQGISIGTNDLTQLLLAVDRDQQQLGSALNGRHPAVKRAIEQLIQTSRKEGIPCSICGQAPVQYPELIDLLVQWGITSISVDVNDVERTYMAIARAEQRLLLEAARQKI